MRWAAHATRLGRRGYRISVRKQEGKRSLERPRRKWEDTIKTNLRYDGEVWTGLMLLRIETSGGLL
jgi:hypothetical protein